MRHRGRTPELARVDNSSYNLPVRLAPLTFLLAACGPEDAHSDGIPARVTEGPGGWTAEVSEGGSLRLAAPDGRSLSLPGPALAEVAFSPAGDRFAYARGRAESALVVVPLPPDGSERLIADWGVSVDRPSFSPDGHRLAFVSGRTGIASVWVVDLDLANPSAAAVQVTNVGLEREPHAPGEPPPGFVPPPEGAPRWLGGSVEVP